MKTRMYCFFIVVIFSACKTNNLYIHVQVPARVTMPNAVKNTGILNRSIPDEQQRIQNAMHQVLSTQSIAMLKEGGAESIRGLKDALMENRRFEEVIILDSLAMKSATLGLFPAPLSWDNVERICNENRIDALFTLEMFDTELKMNSNILPVNITNPMQVMNTVKNTNITTLVKTGWRIYLPGDRRIIDEWGIDQTFSFPGVLNPLAAMEALLQRKESIKQVANQCGHLYADRLLPTRARVYRDYFVRGSSAFKIAKRKARTGNWEGAAELWMKETGSPRHKAAGRACYNMAISNEINGNIDEAIKWAQKAHEDYGVRLSLPYIHTLKTRRAENELLNVQTQQ